MAGPVSCGSVVSGFASDLMVGEVDGLLDEPHEVPVMEAVDDVPPVLSGVDQTAEPQFGQVLTNNRARDKSCFDQFCDGLGALGELPQQVQPGWFCEHSKSPGRAFQ